MKKMIKFALLICLLALGAAAVLSVWYPDIQPTLVRWGTAALEKLWEFVKRVFEDFLAVFFE